MNSTEAVKEIAFSLGFQNVAIGSMDRLVCEFEHYRGWLERGYAASMEYLKCDPQRRADPAFRYPASRSAIIVSVSYYTERAEKPAPFYGSVARYAVGLDYHNVIAAKLMDFKQRISDTLYCRVEGKPFVDDVPLYEKGYASRHGLGFAGKNTLIIGPRLSGTYNFVAELFVDLDLKADHKYEGTCGKCFRCASACPTDAIVEPGYIDSNLCISYLTIENKGGIPLSLRSKVGNWIFGCDICQEVCPYNQKPPPTPWPEFYPENGAGHYLSLSEVLELDSKEKFKAKFAHTPLTRPKLKGLKRNALVVAGNELSMLDDCRLRDEWLVRLLDFVDSTDDTMLKEHAVWALAQAKDARLKSRLLSAISSIDDRRQVDQIKEYLV